MTGAGDGSHALLVLGFESADHDVERWMTMALECCGDHGGTWERRGCGERSRGRRQLARGVPARSLPARCVRRDRSAVGDVRDRDHLGAIPGVPRAVLIAAVSGALREVCGGGSVTCRFTHVYPDGPAPYYTILAPAHARRRARAVGRAQARRRRDAVIAGGGTITHHHAVGRDAPAVV